MGLCVLTPSCCWSRVHCVPAEVLLHCLHPSETCLLTHDTRDKVTSFKSPGKQRHHPVTEWRRVSCPGNMVVWYQGIVSRGGSGTGWRLPLCVWRGETYCSLFPNQMSALIPAVFLKQIHTWKENVIGSTGLTWWIKPPGLCSQWIQLLSVRPRCKLFTFTVHIVYLDVDNIL